MNTNAFSALFSKLENTAARPLPHYRVNPEPPPRLASDPLDLTDECLTAILQAFQL